MSILIKMFEFLAVEGLLLVLLFYIVTFVVVLLQQITGDGLMSRLRRQSLGKGSVYAAIAGAVTPFCSCSTVPVLSGMLRAGIRFGICFTFLIASPVINEGVILVMLREYNLITALFFVAAASTVSIAFGVLVDQLGFATYLRPAVVGPELEGRIESAGGHGGLPYLAVLRFASRTALIELRGAAPYLAIGLLIGAFIYGYVPTEWIASLQSHLAPWLQILVLALLGVPLYVNAVMMVPIALALIAKGMVLGPLVAFLVSGAGTSLPELILLGRLFRPTLVVTHVITIVGSAILLGYGMQWIQGWLGTTHVY